MEDHGSKVVYMYRFSIWPSNINFVLFASTEPRILMESIMPLTLDNILEYEEAESGDCIVGVPEVSSTQQDFTVRLLSNNFSPDYYLWDLSKKIRAFYFPNEVRNIHGGSMVMDERLVFLFRETQCLF